MNTKSVICKVGILLVGFGLGYLVASLPFGEGNGKGDVVKVSKYSRNVVSPAVSALQEKILSDTVEYNKAKASLDIVGSRMRDFKDIVGYALESGDGIAELEQVTTKIKGVSRLAANASAAADDAVDAFDKMADKKKGAAASYESAAQNLTLAYLLVDHQMGVGKEYVSSVDEYLEGKDVNDYPYLAMSRDLWAGYCASQAVLDGDTEELSYWSGTHALIDTDNIDLNLFRNGSTSFPNTLSFANIICQAERMNSILGLVPLLCMKILKDIEGAALSTEMADLIRANDQSDLSLYIIENVQDLDLVGFLRFW